jgi:hypothetical protein
MKLVQFIYNDNVIAQQSADMELDRVEEVKWLLADAYKCLPDEIEARYVGFSSIPILSNYDVSNKGIEPFNSGYPKQADGILMTLDTSDDEFLDAVQGKNIKSFVEKHLHFSF